MLEDIAKQLIEKFINEIKKPKNMEKFKSYLIEPTIKYVIERIHPYIVGSAVVFLLIIIFSIIILMLILYDIKLKK